ncbi:MAG: hypothetical protein WC511_01075 [Candidatus Pacearchaeota archaeon]
MADILCVIMGVADLIAGILILTAFGTNLLGLIFGILMLVKGSMSFIG